MGPLASQKQWTADGSVDKGYLAKSAGYDDQRAWDREEALFAEARQDVEKLKGIVSAEYGQEEVIADEHRNNTRPADGEE